MPPRAPERTRRLAGPACAAAALVAVTALPAAADGWTILGSLRQTFSADSNLQLAPGSDASAGSTTIGNVTFSSANTRSNLSITPGFRASRFFGDAGQSNLIAPQLRAGFSHRVGTVTFNSGANLDIKPTTFSEFGAIDPTEPGFQPDPGDPQIDDGTDIIPDVVTSDLNDIRQNATRISFGANAGLGFQLDPRNTLNLGVNTSLVRFDRDANSLSPSDSVGLSASLGHAVTTNTRATLALSARRVEIDAANPSDSNILNLSTGVTSTVSERLNFSGNLGLNFIDTNRSVGQDDTGIGFSFALRANWRPTEDIGVGLNASQSLQPSSQGDLRTNTNIGLSLSGRVNERERLSASFGVSQQRTSSTFGGGGSDHLVFSSIGYSWAILPDLSANLQYGFRWRPDSGSEATSHDISLTVSKSFTVRP